MMEGALLREVARTQHDKTIQAIRDAVDRIPTTKPSGRSGWDTSERTAKEFRNDLITAMLKLRDEA